MKTSHRATTSIHATAIPTGHRHLRPLPSMVRRAFLGGLLAALSFPLFGQESHPQPGAEPPAAHADLEPARELVKAEKYEEAERLLADLQTAYPDDSPLLLLQGDVLLATKKPDKAVEVLRHAAEIAPQKVRVHFDLGSALSALGDTQGALEAFAKEIELNQDPKIRGMAHLNRSILYDKDQKWNESAAELEALLEAEPDRKEAYGDLAQTYLKAGRPDEAARAVERGAEKGFQSARLHFNVGAAYFNQKAFDKAAQAFQKAIEIQPDLAQAELNLAKTLDQLNRKDEANSHLKRYLELRPNAPDAAEIKKRLAGPAKNATRTHATKGK